MEPVRVLVVEDEFVVANDIRDSVKSMGHVVSGVVTTGRAAIEVATRERPDVVLMDIMLDGEMDGIRAAHEISARQNTPFVFLTSFADDDVLRRARAIGPSGFMVKPFDDRELRANIEVAAHRATVTSKLRKTEAQLSAVMNAAPAVIYLKDTECRYALVNRKFEEWNGVTSEKIKGKTAYDFLPEEIADTFFAMDREVLETGTTRKAEMDEQGPDGTTHTMLIFKFPVLADGGGVFGIGGVEIDITERKRAEDALRESEDRTRKIIENSESGYFFVDREDSFREVNDAWLQMHRYSSADEVIGQHYSLTQVDADFEEAGRLVAKLMSGVSIPEGKFSRRCKDGTVGYHTFSANPVVAQGKIVGLEGFLIDITERKRAEEALRESEQFRRELISGAHESIFMVDREGRVIEANAMGAERLGVTVEQLIGRIIFDFMPPEVADYRRAQLKAMLGSGEDMVTIDQRGDRWFETFAQPHFDEHGQVERVSTFARDITERKELEETLRKQALVWQRMSEGVMVLDNDNLIFDWNPAAEKMFGYSKDEVLGKTTSIIAREKVVGTVTGEIAAGISRDGYWSGEIEFVRKNGSKGVAEVNVMPLRDENGGIVGRVGVNRDITERKRAEHALLEAKEQAEFANLSKTEFLANMSHELRTPLTTINGGADILTTEIFGPIGNPKYLEHAENIKGAGVHLLGLISDLLDVSRIEMDRLELDEENLDVNSILSSCHVLVKGRAHEAGLELNLEFAEGTPVVRGEELRIKQVVLNLLSNAMKFTPRGGTVTLKAATDEDGRVAISVTDTGIGIAAEDQARVMDTFGQVESVFSRKHQGAGIGLPLSKKLMELHGGTLDLESELGVGTVATARFPLERAIQ